MQAFSMIMTFLFGGAILLATGYFLASVQKCRYPEQCEDDRRDWFNTHE